MRCWSVGGYSEKSRTKTERSQTDRGQFDNWEYSIRAIYSNFDEDSDSSRDERHEAGEEREGGPSIINRVLVSAPGGLSYTIGLSLPSALCFLDNLSFECFKL